MESELVKFTDRKNQICEYLKSNDKLKKLHDGSERFVYPYISSYVENKVRELFDIGPDETLLFVQDKIDNSYDIPGGDYAMTVVTDYGVRVVVDARMRYLLCTWQKRSRWIYNGNSLVMFNDLQKTTESISTKFFLGELSENYNDQYGENIAEMFNQFCLWSENSSAHICNVIHKKYLQHCKDFDIKNFLSPNEDEL